MKDNYFYNFLVFALKNYDELKSKAVSIASTVKGYMTGEEICREAKEKGELWIGRKGGKSKIVQDIEEHFWKDRKYCYNKGRSQLQAKRETG